MIEHDELLYEALAAEFECWQTSCERRTQSSDVGRSRGEIVQVVGFDVTRRARSCRTDRGYCDGFDILPLSWSSSKCRLAVNVCGGIGITLLFCSVLLGLPAVSGRTSPVCWMTSHCTWMYLEPAGFFCLKFQSDKREGRRRLDVLPRWHVQRWTVPSAPDVIVTVIVMLGWLNARSSIFMVIFSWRSELLSWRADATASEPKLRHGQNHYGRYSYRVGCKKWGIKIFRSYSAPV